MIRVVLENDKCLPERGHKWDAGLDLKSNNATFDLKAGAKVKVYTGVKIDIPPRNVGIIVPRSGMGSKFRVTLANDVGVIDSGYTGEIICWLVNDGHQDVTIERFDRICQLMILPVNMDNLRPVDKLRDTDRGTGGFGSTGHSSPKELKTAEQAEDES